MTRIIFPSYFINTFCSNLKCYKHSFINQYLSLNIKLFIITLKKYHLIGSRTKNSIHISNEVTFPLCLPLVLQLVNTGYKIPCKSVCLEQVTFNSCRNSALENLKINHLSLPVDILLRHFTSSEPTSQITVKLLSFC